MIVYRALNCNKVKYSTLDNIITYDSRGTSGINIHIDLHSILSDIYSNKTIKEETGQLTETEYISISSSVINMIAHYRHYFNKKQIPSKFFLYFSNKRPAYNMSISPMYAINLYERYNNKSACSINVMDNVNLIKTIVKYIPNCYFIDYSGVEQLTSCAYMINNYTLNQYRNLVISKDPLWYQLINLERTEILRLKRDESYIVNKSNVYTHLLSASKYEVGKISTEFLGLIYAFSGVKSRFIEGIKGWTILKIIKTLDTSIMEGNIINEYHYKVNSVVSEIYDGDEKDYLLENYELVDMRKQLGKISTANIEMLSMLEDKFSKDGLLELNTKIYKGEYSLMCEELNEGVMKKHARTIQW
jgi:hypothetical protein